MKILIGSENKSKIQGAKEAFDKYFEDVTIEGIKVDSNVPDEPVDIEIYAGAKNRVDNLIKYAKENNIEAEYFLAIESGITNLLGEWIIVNVAIIRDKNGFESFGTSSGFPVPKRYIKNIIDNDLSEVIKSIYKHEDFSYNIGGISLLTNNVISRIDITRDAFIMALTTQINEYWTDKLIIKKKTYKR